MEDAGTIIVRFNASNRLYQIDVNGNLEGPKELIKDEYAGDISKGKTDAGKTQDNPYVISCIEDLVVFSRMAGDVNNKKPFENQFVILERPLDFNSIFSYDDYTTKEYGDLNGDGTEDELKTELTKQGDTCVGFTPIAKFYGTFDGQNKKISNLYINKESGYVGLFGENYGTIKNLGVNNITLKGNKTSAGGITAITSNANGKLLNCYAEGENSYTNKEGTSYVGLLSGKVIHGALIEQCYNSGKLEINGTGEIRVGGIAGDSVNSGKVYKSYNTVEINAFISGGIVGISNGGIISECYNLADITSESYMAGGICGSSNWTSSIITNCYNIGKIEASYKARWYSSIQYKLF